MTEAGPVPPAPPDAALRVVVVDDEPLAREDLLAALGESGDLAVVAVCGSGAEALRSVRQLAPDVMFIDVNMPGMNGFSVVSQLDPATMPYVVFVTAFDKYAIDAFRVRALDYILKPVKPGRLHMAVERAREQVRQRAAVDWASSIQELARAQAEAPGAWTEFMIRIGTRDVIVRADDVDWIEADSYYARLHVRDKSFLLRERMHVLEKRLNPRQFARVHRSAIVNCDRVVEVVHDRRGDHYVVLTSGARLRASAQRWMEFQAAMRRRGQPDAAS